MENIRGAKLIAAAILIAAGAICLAIGEAQRALSLVGLALVAVGVPLMVFQWRGPKQQLREESDDSLERTIETGFKEAKDH